MMKTPTLLLSLLALSAWTASAQVAIAVLNPIFNLDQLQCSPGEYCGYAGISGWLIGPNTSVLKASSTQFKGATAEGLYVAAIGNTSSTGSILQTLGSTVQANTTYILKIKVGARSDYPFTGYSAGLVAGNVTVASSNSATPVGGSFVIDEITYNSGAAPAELGMPLQVFVRSLGTGQVAVAAVTLTATAN